MVHRKVLAPAPIPVNPDEGEEGVVMFAVPETTVHIPIPEVGVLPASVAVFEQMS
jgi:hypothetical protein